jgi:hypothetical protein
MLYFSSIKVQERKIKEYSSDNSRPTTDILDCGLDKNTNENFGYT